MASKYIIKNATVISVDPSIGTLKNCDVLIEDNIIAAVGPNLEHTVHHIEIDGTNAIVSPGFVDTHRHTWETQLRTVTTDDVLPGYGLEIRLKLGSCYTAQDAYIGNYCGALESIDNGITYLVDHSHIMNSPEHSNAALKGLKDAKIRAVFCYGLYPNPAWPGSVMDEKLENEQPEWRFDDARRIREQFFKANAPEDLLRFGFALSEGDMIPFEQFLKELEVGRSMGTALTTAHVSLGKYDPGKFLARQLNERNLLGPDILFSHGTSFAEDELDAIKAAGVGLTSTPDTELQMGMGHPIAFSAKDRGCKASLGVDVVCNNPGDMFQQMRLLLQAQRHTEHYADPKAPSKISRTCAEALDLATMGGARAVGLENVIGSITPRKRADLIITRCESTRLVPVRDPVGALVLYANGSDVSEVFINGELVKEKGKLVGVDWPKVREQLRASTDAIFERYEKAPHAELKQAMDQVFADSFGA